MPSDTLFECVVKTFAELGAAEPGAVSRTLLLQDRRFVGHCYRCGGLQALLVPGSGRVEFYDAAGKHLRTVQPVAAAVKDAA